MIKRIVIAGSRDYNNYDEAKNYIDFCISRIRKNYDIIIVSGGCRGADMLGERYAKENGFKYIEVSAVHTAVGFYEKLGFVSEGDFYLETGVNHIYMKKIL